MVEEEDLIEIVLELAPLDLVVVGTDVLAMMESQVIQYAMVVGVMQLPILVVEVVDQGVAPVLHRLEMVEVDCVLFLTHSNYKYNLKNYAYIY